MLFLQCGECGFKTVPGTLEFGAPCPRCVSRGDRGRLTADDPRPTIPGARRWWIWRKSRSGVSS